MRDDAHTLQATWDQVWSKRDPGSAAESVHAHTSDKCIATHLPFVDEVLAALPKGSRCVDAGCGLGYWVTHMARHGHRGVGIDVAQGTLRRVRGVAPPETDFLLGDLHAAPVRDGAFDFVLSVGVIEHFTDPQPMLRELRRLLAPRGKALITTPNWWSTHTVTRPVARALGKWELGYETSYSPTGLARHAERAGFNVARRGVMPGGETFGSFPASLPVVGKPLDARLRKLSYTLERRTNRIGFWSYVLGSS